MKNTSLDPKGGTPSAVFVVLDTNILRNQLRDVMKVLRPFQEHVVVAIPQIPVDESLKPPRERPRRRLYRLACLKEDRTAEYLEKINAIRGELADEGFKVEIVRVLHVLNIARPDYAYLESKDSSLLPKIIRFLVGKGGRYYPTLRQVVNCMQDSAEQPHIESSVVENVDAVFWELLGWCCSLTRATHAKRQCVEQCEALFNVLGDVLIVDSANRLARDNKDAEVFLATNNVADI